GKLIDDWVLTGNCFAEVTYVSETHIDPDAGNLVSGYTGPRVYRISPNDIVFNAVAADFEHSPKIKRSIKSVGELKRDIEENPELQYEQEVFNKVLNIRSELSKFSVEEVDKSLQMEFDGFGTFGSYMKSGYVELLDFYGDIYDKDTGEFYKNYVVTVVDRRW